MTRLLGYRPQGGSSVADDVSDKANGDVRSRNAGHASRNGWSPPLLTPLPFNWSIPRDGFPELEPLLRAIQSRVSGLGKGFVPLTWAFVPPLLFGSDVLLRTTVASGDGRFRTG